MAKTIDQKEIFKEHFLEPETRCGHYVSSETTALWKSMLDMVEEVDRICRKYNLKYFLVAGSLLGAIRHKGFIPWDDDIDVALFRDDYDKLEKILPKELPSNMFMQTLGTDPEYFTPHMKIRLDGTTAIQGNVEKEHHCYNMGIFIDVFSLDGVPNTKIGNIIVKSLTARLNDMVIYHNMKQTNSTWKKIKKIIYDILWFILGASVIHRFREWSYSIVPIRNNGDCVQNPGVWGYNQRYRYKVIDLINTIDVPFEYLMLKVPVNYEKILTDIYGDWHKFIKGDSAHNLVDISCKTDYKVVLKEKYGYTEEELKKCQKKKDN